MRLIIPDESYKKLRESGLIIRQMQTITGREQIPIPFQLLHTNYGAIIITQNIEEAYRILRLPDGEPGVVEGFTVAEYAKKTGKSRQWINQKINNGKLRAEKIGRIWVIYGGKKENETGR